jgi:hypothetical protein
MTSILNFMFTVIVIPLKLLKKSAEDYPTDVIDMYNFDLVSRLIGEVERKIYV